MELVQNFIIFQYHRIIVYCTHVQFRFGIVTLNEITPTSTFNTELTIQTFLVQPVQDFLSK